MRSGWARSTRARVEPLRDPARGVVPLRPGARRARHRMAGLRPARGARRTTPTPYGTNNEFGLRLPPRQHALHPRGHGPARHTTPSSTRSTPSDRRGPHPLIISGPARARQPLLQERPDQSRSSRGRRRSWRASHRDRGARRRATTSSTKSRRRCRAPSRASRCERPEHRDISTTLADGCSTTSAGASGPRPLQEGRGLRDQGRAGHHRGRVNGRMMPGTPLVRNGLHQGSRQGRRQDRVGKSDLATSRSRILQDVRQARGDEGTARRRRRVAKIYVSNVTVVRPTHSRCPASTTGRGHKSEGRSSRRSAPRSSRAREGPAALVGTVSIEKSEHLSRLLKKRGIPHQVLNAKYHEREAEIIAQAGREKSVTIATNMAGRGTDILLGGNPDYLAKELMRKKGLDPALAPPEARQTAWEEASKVTQPEHERVVKLGGLHIIGTERHESRASTTSCAAIGAGDPALALLRPRGRPAPDLRLRAYSTHQERRGGGSEPIETSSSRGPSAPPRTGRDAQLRDPKASPRIRRRDEQQARLSTASPRHPRGREPGGPDPSSGQRVAEGRSSVRAARRPC